MLTNNRRLHLFLLFILTCIGYSLSASAQIGTIGDGDDLNVSLSFSPSTIPSGSSSTLSLSVSGNLGPVICSFIGLSQVPGSVSPPLSISVTAITPLSVSALCEEQQVFGDIPPKTGFANAQLNINGPALPPVVESSFVPNVIELGQTTSFQWTSIGASSCETFGAVPGEVGEVDREEDFTPMSMGTFEATVTCSNASGSTSSTSSVTVFNSTDLPLVVANYNPNVLTGSGFSNLSWASTNANTCRVPSISGLFELATSGTFINQFINFSTFTQVICSGDGGVSSAFANVTVLNGRTTKDFSNSLNGSGTMSISSDMNASELPFGIDSEIDGILLAELGLRDTHNKLKSLAIDLNDDDIDDRLIFSADSKKLYVLINSNGEFIQINRIINGVTGIQDIASINITHDGVLNVQINQ